MWEVKRKNQNLDLWHSNLIRFLNNFELSNGSTLNAAKKKKEKKCCTKKLLSRVGKFQMVDRISGVGSYVAVDEMQGFAKRKRNSDKALRRKFSRIGFRDKLQRRVARHENFKNFIYQNPKYVGWTTLFEDGFFCKAQILKNLIKFLIQIVKTLQLFFQPCLRSTLKFMKPWKIDLDQSHLHNKII